MNKINLDDIKSGKESKYILVIAVAKRARQIAQEAEFRGILLDETPVNLAIKDFEANKLDIIQE